jgi:hypothetical protein
VSRRIGDVLAGEVFAAEEVRVAIAVVNELLGIEEDEIDAVLALKRLHIMGELAKQSGPAGAVVGPNEYALGVDAVLIGERAGVVMGAKEDALGTFGMPLDDQVGEIDARAVERMPGRKLLADDAAAELFEMSGDVFLLPAHAFRAGDARANCTDVLQVSVRTLSVDGNVGKRQLRIDRPLRQRAVVPRGQSHQPHADSGQQEAVEPGNAAPAAGRGRFGGGTGQGTAFGKGETFSIAGLRASFHARRKLRFSSHHGSA